MKILYHHRIASKDGQYVHVEEIIKALRKQGHDVIVVSPQLVEQSDFGSDGGWVSKLRQNVPQIISESLEFSYSIWVFCKLCYAIMKHRPDCIYERYNLFLPSGIWAKKIFQLKLLLEVNSPLYDERKKYGGIALNRIAKWSEYYAWRNADHVLPVTRVLASYIIKAGVPDSRITVLPNGIDPSLFYPSDEPNRDKEFHDKLVIGFVGFCREWHRLDQVLKLIASEENPNLMLLIVGDGPVIEQLQELARSLQLQERFHITGLVDRQNMPHWLNQIDIAIQPAVTPWASPLKLIEYLAKGKAIVAPNNPNIRELLSDDVNALLFEPENAESMIQKIREIIEDKSLRMRLQTQAHNTIKEQNLTWNHNAMRIERIFQENITQSGK
ncbi:glycosyltransferase family 4 protein [Vibrio ziniensis]|uniref:Glycosyltransferase family 4 protein n=1 Tax=Vibrio ziniensis TaxID=2711221 RepID=A0A6G7CQW9_9VIBR|nr:glycosyltransferase family 4 protein [Vibrio ziniensis]QIH44505.1 glycosyltransferase family 4 protein [Vibrio ziniensis]